MAGRQALHASSPPGARIATAAHTHTRLLCPPFCVQGEVAPAAREMAAGGKPVYEFTSSYSEEGLVRLIQNVELPTSAWGSDVGAEAKGKAAP